MGLTPALFGSIQARSVLPHSLRRHRKRHPGTAEVEQQEDGQDGQRLAEIGSGGTHLLHESRRSAKSPHRSGSRTENADEHGDAESTVTFAQLVMPKTYHRWLPMFSGLAVPFSVLLDIPGVTERWYIRTEGYDVVETQPNPPVLVAGVAISLALGVLANIALICRFLEKSPKKSTIIAIVCLTMHDILSAVIVIAFGVIHAVDDGFTYGESFWLSVASMVASILVNITLVIDFVVSSRRKGEFSSGLTTKQRTLVITVMALLIYIAVGSLAWSFLLGLTYVNSLYFTVCTVTTVGFGDIYPSTTPARIFLFFFASGGIVVLALTVAVARDTVVETFERAYRSRRDRLAEQARKRREEKRQLAQERKEELQRRQCEIDGASPEEIEARVRANRQQEQRDQYVPMEPGTAFSFTVHHGRSLLRKAWWSFRARFSKDLPGMDRAHQDQILAHDKRAEEGPPDDTEEGRYRKMRAEMDKEQKTEFRVKLGVVFFLFLVFWLVGAMVFTFTESWTYFEALYFGYVYFSTLGYGDYSPKSSAGRAFFVAWSILGIGNMTLLFTVLSEATSTGYQSALRSSRVERTLRILAQRIDDDNGDQPDPAEEVALEELPDRLINAARSFNEHARYFLHGREGDVPRDLQPVLHMAEELDQRFRESSGEEKQLSEAHERTRRALFMMSYERTLDSLISTAESVKALLAEKSASLKRMDELNRELEDIIAEARGELEEEQEEEEEEQEEEDGQGESREDDVDDLDRSEEDSHPSPASRRQPQQFPTSPSAVRAPSRQSTLPDRAVEARAAASKILSDTEEVRLYRARTHSGAKRRQAAKD